MLIPVLNIGSDTRVVCFTCTCKIRADTTKLIPIVYVRVWEFSQLLVCTEVKRVTSYSRKTCSGRVVKYQHL